MDDSPDEVKIIQLDDYREGSETTSIEFGNKDSDWDDQDSIRVPGGTKKQIRWIRVREFYMKNQDVNLSQLAAKFKISVGSISKKAAEEDWKNKRKTYYLQTSQALEENHADMLVKHRLDHASLTGGVVSIIQDIIDEIKEHGFVKSDGSPITSSMTKVEIANTLAMAAFKASEGDRLNLGLKPGDTAAQEVKDQTLEILQRELVPEKIPVNNEGRALGTAS